MYKPDGYAFSFQKSSDKLKKKEFIQALAARMSTDKETAEKWVDAYIDTLFDAFQSNQGITLKGFGGFYLKKKANQPYLHSIPGKSFGLY